jgi:hypothetical protein
VASRILKMNYDIEGCDYWGHGPHVPPSWLSPRGQLIFATVEAEFVRQGAIENCGYVSFIPDDKKTDLDGRFSLAKMASQIDKALTQEELK